MPAISTPLPPPDDIHKNDPLPFLAVGQIREYNIVLEHFKGPNYSLPGVGPFRDEDKFWLSGECILRFLRATKWNAASAIRRLEATLKWRNEFGVARLLNVRLVNAKTEGSDIVLGHDTQGRPSLFIMDKQKMATKRKQLELIVLLLEDCCALMPAGVETFNLLVDFREHPKNPISRTRRLLKILQAHYPERLDSIITVKIPPVLKIVTKSLLTVLDPKTRAKCKFNPDTFKPDIFKPEGIMRQSWGGTMNREEYWFKLIKLTHDRRLVWRVRWKELGGTIGIREWDYKHPGDGNPESEPRPTDEGIARENVPGMDDLAVGQGRVAATVVATGADYSAQPLEAINPDPLIQTPTVAAVGGNHGSQQSEASDRDPMLLMENPYRHLWFPHELSRKGSEPRPTGDQMEVIQRIN